MAATTESCGGKYIRVYHQGLGYSTLYFHLQSFIVTSGPVARKQAIAYSDNTGSPECTSGAHLHFTARNGQAGTDNLDPYGWSGPPGSGEDPWVAGRAFGTLFAIRLATMTGTSGTNLSVAEGVISTAPSPNVGTVTDYSLAGNRIGIVDTARNCSVKDGMTGAGWVLEAGGVNKVALSGRRIVIATNGAVSYKDGDLNAGWVLAATGSFSQIAVDASAGRVGFMAGSFFWINVGGVNYLMATDATSIALGAGWIGYIDTSGVPKVKAGQNDQWTPEMPPYGSGPATFLSLGGSGDDKRIGVIRGQQASIRTGGLTGSWTGVGGNFTEIRVNSGRFAVRNTAGQIAAKEGALNGPWINYPGTALSVRLN